MKKLLVCLLAGLLAGSCRKDVEPAYDFQRLSSYWGVFGVMPTTDGGFLVGTTRTAEYKDQQDGFTNYFYNLSLVKTNVAGDVQWAKTFQQPKNEVGRAMVTLPDGNLLIAADASLVEGGGSFTKITPAGDIVWTRSFHPDAQVLINALVVDKAGMVYVGGSYTQPTGYKSNKTTREWVAQADANGVFLWEYLPGATTFPARTASMALAADGSLIALVNTGSNTSVVRQFSGTSTPRLVTTLSSPSDHPQLLQTTLSGAILLAGSQVFTTPDRTTNNQTLWLVDPTGQSIIVKTTGPAATTYLQFDRLVGGSCLLVSPYVNVGKLGVRWQAFSEAGALLTEHVVFTDDKTLLYNSPYGSEVPVRGYFLQLDDGSAVLVISQEVQTAERSRLLKMYRMEPDGTLRWAKALEP